MKGPRRVGIAGLGVIAPYHIAAVQRFASEFRLDAACDPDPSTHSRVVCPAFCSIEQMVAAIPLDVVVVATPPATHATLGTAALAIGLDVLLEKPPTLTYTDYAALESVASQTGALLYAAFHFAFGREIVWFLEHRAAAEDSLGSLSGVKAGFFDPYLAGSEVERRALHLNGSWADSGPNALSVLGRLVPTFSTIERHATYLPSYGHDVNAECTLSFTNHDGSGGLAVVTTNWGLGLKQKSTLLAYDGGNGSLRLDHSREQVVLTTPNGDRRILFQTDSPQSHMQAHYDGMYRDFARSLRERTDNHRYTRRVLDALWSSPSHQNELTE